MIDISTWKEFRVGNYFHGIRGTSRKMQELDDGLTPIIAAARYNQGIAGYYNIPSEYENAITISCNGVGCGSTYYHDYPFAITGDAIVLENIGKVPQGALHFIAAVYDAYFSRKYSYADKCSADKAEAELIALPATSDGQPDWDYMESYMKAVMEESEKSLENLKKADNTKHLIDVSAWKEFCVGELFSCETTLGIPSKNDLEDGNINYITRSAIDNGFSGTCGNKDHENKGNCITIGAEGFVAFWQSEDFVAGNKVYALRHPDMNEINGLFVCSALNALSDRYSFADARVLDKIKVEIIKLPVTSDGQPDWQYMEDCMKNIMDKQEMAADNLLKNA